MPRKTLPHLNQGYVQQTPNSCWAACTRYSWNYFKSRIGHPFNSDKALADYLGMDENGEANLDSVLQEMGLWQAGDTDYIPSFDNIVSAIDNGEMICACVYSQRRSARINESVTGGHYVVIIGYDTDQFMIQVMNPDDGSIEWQLFDHLKYQWPDGHFDYWCGTSYTGNAS